MPTILSSRHAELTINGHRFTGFSDDDPPVEFPDIELITTMRGRDGAMYASDTAIQGGEVTVKLLPTSQSAKQVLRWMTEILRGGRMLFQGSYADTELGYSVQLKGGMLKTAPPSVVPGKTYEATFEFEQLLPDYDGANFAPAPQVASP